MELIRTDIDLLLEKTVDIAKEDFSFKINKIEIDKLLENTRDWN